MPASAISAPQVHEAEVRPTDPCRPVSSQVRDLGPISGAPSGLLKDVTRAVTVIIATVVGLTFLFGFGNVLGLALRLGVPVWVAPLVAPAVDLSILGLLPATRHLALHGVSVDDLRPLRRFTLFVSAVSLALNVAEPLLAGKYGKAAFDAVGPVLLIGWAEIGPRVLQTLARTVASPCRAGTAQSVADESLEAVEVPTSVIADDLVRARRADARHWAAHKRPISSETLRKQLEIGADHARELVAAVRTELATKVCRSVI